MAALNVFFRDIGNVARHVLRLWFYLSPALYGADTIAKLGSPTDDREVMRLNPFFAIFESYRDVIYYGTMPDLAAGGSCSSVSLVLLVLATLFFKRLEPAFAKVL